MAAVFLVAGLLKAWDPQAFVLDVARLQVLPRALVGPAAILVPWLEIVAAVAVLTPWRAAGRVFVGALLAAFTTLLLVALIRGTSTSCGCFGGEGRLDVALIRNVLLGSLLALSCRRSAPASPASSTPR